VYGTFVKMSKPKENATTILRLVSTIRQVRSSREKVWNLKWVLLKTDGQNTTSLMTILTTGEQQIYKLGSYYGLFVRKAGIRKGTVRHPLVQDKENLHFERILYGALYFKCGDLPPHLKQKKE